MIEVQRSQKGNILECNAVTSGLLTACAIRGKINGVLMCRNCTLEKTCEDNC